MRRALRVTTMAAFAGFFFLFAFGATGCRDEGPAERAGEKIDQAVQNTRESLEDAVDDDGPLEKAGRKLDEAAEDVKEGVDGS